MKKLVSIIIVSYNTRVLLKQCLDSLYHHADLRSSEVIIVDNNSTDGTVEMVSENFPSVILLQNNENKGFAAANNQAAAIATGEFLLLLNSDTELIDRSIERIISYFQEHPEVSIGGCKLLNGDRTLQPSCRSFPTIWNIFTETFFLYSLFPRTKLFGSYHMTYFNYDAVKTVDVIMGAFMLIRKSVVDTIGLFDASFFMYAEETDFCYRAQLHGYSTIFYPGTSIVHYGGGSIQNKTQYFIQIHTAQIKFIKKHFSGISYLAGMMLKLTGVFLRVPVYFIAGIVTVDTALIRKAYSYLSVIRSIGAQ